MDLLYSRYSNPLEFMHLYTEQGRFGEFVTEILEMDQKRKTEAAKKDDEQKLWEIYLHTMADKPFNNWKKEVLSNNSGSQKPVSLSAGNAASGQADRHAATGP